MKHIKRKFLSELSKSDADKLKALSQSKAYTVDEIKSAKVAKDKAIFMEFANDRCVKFNQITHLGKSYFIPEPDPVLIYFNNAQHNFRGIEMAKKEFLAAVDFGPATLDTKISHNLYGFILVSSGFIIFLFTSIEAMVNKVIPVDFKYMKEGKRNTEIYSYNQIQQNLSFSEKLEDVLLKLTNKSFKKDHPTKFQHIINLREFRDEIVHTRKDTDVHSPYNYIIKRALGFKYDDTIYAVRDLINYYCPNLIEECNCGKDF